MKRVILAALSTIAGLSLLLSFKTRPATTVATAPVAAGTNPGESDTAAGAAGSTNTTNGAATKTVTGSAVETRYGPVQVRITVANGQITAVDAVEYPTESPKDSQINAYAIPQLNQEVLAAKSAHIDMISGATYTSTGYISSLQSALTQAGLA